MAQQKLLRDLEVADRGAGVRVYGHDGTSIELDTYWPVGAAEPRAVRGHRPLTKNLVDVLRWQPPRREVPPREPMLGPTFAHMKPYQVEGVRQAVQDGGRKIIADEMGLGKTLQAIGIMCYYATEWPLLVVCPSSLKNNWAREFLPHACGAPITIINKSSDNVPTEGVVIMSYEMLVMLVARSLHFRCVILDESHYIKNRESKRTKAAATLCMRADRVVLLSGTPLNRPSDLYTQMRCVASMYTNFHGAGMARAGVLYYADRYCAPERKFLRGKTIWDCSGSSRLEELHLVVSKVMIRRFKRDVLRQLPALERERVTVWRSDDPLPNAPDNPLDDREFMELVRKTCQDKIPHVVSYFGDVIKPALAENIKILVFGHHRAMLDAVQALFKPDEYVRIDGSVPSDRRAALVDRFQTDPGVHVALLSIAATGVGLTLTAATMVVFLELVFGPDQTAQAEARAHRIGQEYPVLVRYLYAENTTDEIIWRILQNKTNVAGQTLENRRSFIGFEKVERAQNVGE